MSQLATGFLGALIALILNALFQRFQNRDYLAHLAAICGAHLDQIRQDLRDHVRVSDGKAYFGETQYQEAVVGHFLYDVLISNVARISDVPSLKNTIEFFHHYKVNMSTVRARLDSEGSTTIQLTEGTFNNLLARLDRAVEELGHLAAGNRFTNWFRRLTGKPPRGPVLIRVPSSSPGR